MERRTFKTAAIVGLVAVTILLIILLCYYFLNSPDDASHIELPDYTVISSDEPISENTLPFADVNTKNAAQVLQTITPLDAYHRVLTLEYYWENDSFEQTAELWHRNGETRLILSEADSSQKNILLRSDGAWMWYDQEEPVSIAAGELTLEDFIGIPNYTELKDSSEMLDAAYATLAGADGTACVYARWQVTDGYTTSCWISLGSGLLERAVIEESGAMVYRMQQNAVERLLPGDDNYDAPFFLPGESS